MEAGFKGLNLNSIRLRRILEIGHFHEPAGAQVWVICSGRGSRDHGFEAGSRLARGKCGRLLCQLCAQ
jgi:hypothetical protein